jgi:hypothetical protein
MHDLVLIFFVDLPIYLYIEPHSHGQYLLQTTGVTSLTRSNKFYTPLTAHIPDVEIVRVTIY